MPIFDHDGREIVRILDNQGREIEAVYDQNGMVVYEKIREITGTSPLIFASRVAGTLTDYRIYGETLQDGTPSPDMPVDVVGCGEWDSVSNSYKLPVTTTNGTDTVTTPIYVGSEPLYRIGEYADYVDYSSGKIMRRIKKLVLTGEEKFEKNYPQSTSYLYYASRSIFPGSIGITPVICNELPVRATAPIEVIGINTNSPFPSVYFNFGADIMNALPSGNTVAGLKEYLAVKYATGTPVTVWYVLQEPIEEDPPVPFPELPNLSGTNTMSIGTTVKPSQMYIKGKIKPDGYGKLVDKNGMYILDKNGVRLTVHGQGASN